MFLFLPEFSCVVTSPSSLIVCCSFSSDSFFSFVSVLLLFLGLMCVLCLFVFVLEHSYLHCFCGPSLFLLPSYCYCCAVTGTDPFLLMFLRCLISHLCFCLLHLCCLFPPPPSLPSLRHSQGGIQRDKSVSVQSESSRMGQTSSSRYGSARAGASSLTAKFTELCWHAHRQRPHHETQRPDPRQR